MDKDYAKYLLKKTKQDYNLISQDFSRTREKVWNEIGFLFYNYLKENERVLDLGCGNGRYYEFFKDRNIGYIGVDNSESLIKIAKEKYPKARFQIEDALALSFSDNYFDKIYSIAVLHHIPSQKLRMQFLKEAKRVLKPKGKIIITVWKFHEKKERRLLLKYSFLKLLGKSKLDFKDILEPWGNKTLRYYHWFSKRELKRLLKKAGFKIEEIGVIKNKRGNRQNIYAIVQRVG